MDLHSQNQHEIKELLNIYEQIKKGFNNAYLEDEDFEFLCDYFEEQENYKKSLEIINYGVETHPYSADLKIRKADLLIFFNQINEADELLEEIVLLDNYNIDYYILKFEIFVFQQKIDAGNEFINKALLNFEKKDQVEILESIIEILNEYAIYNKITDYLFRILDIDPDNNSALNDISFWAQMTNQIEESVDFHLKLIYKNPYNHLVWFNLGLNYQSLGLYEKAIEAYEYSLAINETFEYAIRNLAIVYIATKKHEKAIDQLEHLVDLLERPESHLYAVLGSCSIRIKKYDNAIQHYKTALSLDNTNIFLMVSLSKLFIKQKKYAEALELLKKVILMKPSFSKYQDLVGDCYVGVKNYSYALHHYFLYLVNKKKSLSVWKKYLHCLSLNLEFENGFQKSVLAFETTRNPVFLTFSFFFKKKINVNNNLLITEHNIINKKIFKHVLRYFSECKNEPWVNSFLQDLD